MRAINAVTELNRAGETLTPITTIAIHDEADTRAWFVREADEHVCLHPGRGTHAAGPGPAAGPAADPTRSRAPISTPSCSWIRCTPPERTRSGSAGALRPSTTGSRRRVSSPGSCSSARRARRSASSRTGRRRDGSRKGSASRWHGRTDSTRAGDGSRSRSWRTRYGNIWPVGVRDCSIQLGGRKLLTESSCAAPGPVVDEELREAAVKLCRAASYSGVGSVEFLLEPDSGWFEFVQFTTGLQLEHPVTEVTTGLDLVKLQLQLALGLSLHGEPPATWGHAVGAVVCAEDPEQGFAAAAGRIALFRPPAGAGIRVDTGVAEGDVTPGGYSSPIAKIIAWGRDREEALDRLERALAQCAVIVEGGTTNRSFLLSLLGQPELRRATFDHRWLERLVEIDGHVPPLDPVALLYAAVEAYDTEHAAAQAWFYATAARGRPEIPRSIGQSVELRYRGAAYRLTVFRLGPGDYRIDTGHGSADVHVDRYGPFESHLTCGERTYHVLSAASGPDRLVEVDGVAHSVSREGEGAVRAGGPAFVIDVLVERGDEVSQGDPLVRLETMKMESVVRAPFPGTVRSVEVTGNMQVEAGAPLVVLRPVERPSGRSWASEPVDLSAMCVDGDGDEPPYQRLRPYLLGYDLEESSVRRLLEEYRKFRASKPVSRAPDPEEEDALALFVDIGLLFRPAPDLADNVQGDEPPEESSPSTQEHLLTYLASLDPDRSRLPAGYRRRLRRALARYGVDSLERTPALEEALLWMFRSLRRFEETAEVVTTILQSRLVAAAATAGADVASAGPSGGDRVADSAAAQQLRALLLRVAGAAELRQQTVADLARELRFRYFEEPVLEQAFRAVYTETDRLLDALRDDPAAPGRASWMEEVESCPQPLRARLRQRYQGAEVPYQKVLLELHLRRYYTHPRPARPRCARRRRRRRRRVPALLGRLRTRTETGPRRRRLHPLDKMTRGRGCDRTPCGARRTRPAPRGRPRDVAWRSTGGGRVDGGGLAGPAHALRLRS